jgi:PPK2 family polyphosphate:nucleotide phosphotransferase
MSHAKHKLSSRVSERYRVDHGERFRLKSVDPDDRAGYESEEHAGDTLAKGIARLAELQDMLYAQDRWAILIVIQAMDAAGKDSVIKHVMSGVNPQGCQVTSFKAPSAEELHHDYLWRVTKSLPENGRIGIFNRSYYEEVLVVRVHPEILAAQKLPPSLVTKNIWQERFKDMRAFEKHLTRNGVVIRKFFLHVSKAEQKRRFLSRLDEPEKNWKFSIGDAAERSHWKAYMSAYEDMIRNTSTPEAPWYVVPADHKWFTHAVVAGAIVHALEGLHLAYPEVGPARQKELRAARRALVRKS